MVMDNPSSGLMVTATLFHSGVATVLLESLHYESSGIFLHTLKFTKILSIKVVMTVLFHPDTLLLIMIRITSSLYGRLTLLVFPLNQMLYRSPQTNLVNCHLLLKALS